jgi:hypothetical protein
MSEITRIENSITQGLERLDSEANSSEFESFFQSARRHLDASATVTPVNSSSSDGSMTDVLMSALDRGFKHSREISAIGSEMRMLSLRNDPLSSELLAKKAALAMETAHSASQLKAGVMYVSKTVQGINSLLKMQ